MSRVLLARIPSPFPPHSFLSFLFHNTIRSNKQAVGNKDSLILPFKQKCQRLLLLFPGRLKGSECVHATQSRALPAPYLPRKLPIKPPFHTLLNTPLPLSFSLFFSLTLHLSVILYLALAQASHFPQQRAPTQGPGRQQNTSGGLLFYLIALPAPQEKAFNTSL